MALLMGLSVLSCSSDDESEEITQMNRAILTRATNNSWFVEKGEDANGSYILKYQFSQNTYTCKHEWYTTDSLGKKSSTSVTTNGKWRVVRDILYMENEDGKVTQYRMENVGTSQLKEGGIEVNHLYLYEYTEGRDVPGDRYYYGHYSIEPTKHWTYIIWMINPIF